VSSNIYTSQMRHGLHKIWTHAITTDFCVPKIPMQCTHFLCMTSNSVCSECMQNHRAHGFQKSKFLQLHSINSDTIPQIVKWGRKNVWLLHAGWCHGHSKFITDGTERSWQLACCGPIDLQVWSIVIIIEEDNKRES
jgi:hypothetical protein